mmetsp:Transcript_59837/g.157328  ORF Transcript_59837/g.157328 Transcript_59837/m.157328 type:complete len:226 (-) Transcript_59837:22-699(-)
MLLPHGDLRDPLSHQGEHARRRLALRVAPGVGAPEVDVLLRQLPGRRPVHNVDEPAVPNVPAERVLVWDRDARLAPEVDAVDGQHLSHLVVEGQEGLLDGQRGPILVASVLRQPDLEPGRGALPTLVLHVDLEALLLLRLDELGLVVVLVVLGAFPSLPVRRPLRGDARVGLGRHALDLEELVGIVAVNGRRLRVHRAPKPLGRPTPERGTGAVGPASREAGQKL